MPGVFRKPCFPDAPSLDVCPPIPQTEEWRNVILRQMASGNPLQMKVAREANDHDPELRACFPAEDPHVPLQLFSRDKEVRQAGLESFKSNPVYWAGKTETKELLVGLSLSGDEGKATAKELMVSLSAFADGKELIARTIPYLPDADTKNLAGDLLMDIAPRGPESPHKFSDSAVLAAAREGSQADALGTALAAAREGSQPASHPVVEAPDSSGGSPNPARDDTTSLPRHPAPKSWPMPSARRSLPLVKEARPIPIVSPPLAGASALPTDSPTLLQVIVENGGLVAGQSGQVESFQNLLSEDPAFAQKASRTISDGINRLSQDRDTQRAVLKSGNQEIPPSIGIDSLEIGFDFLHEEAIPGLEEKKSGIIVNLQIRPASSSGNQRPDVSFGTHSRPSREERLMAAFPLPVKAIRRERGGHQETPDPIVVFVPFSPQVTRPRDLERQFFQMAVNLLFARELQGRAQPVRDGSHASDRKGGGEHQGQQGSGDSHDREGGSGDRDREERDQPDGGWDDAGETAEDAAP